MKITMTKESIEQLLNHLQRVESYIYECNVKNIGYLNRLKPEASMNEKFEALRKKIEAMIKLKKGK